MADPTATSNGTRRLADAVRAAKIAAAHRSDIVIDIREADRARLEIFAEELQSIMDAVPAEDDLFDFAMSGGPQPRFWVDSTAHVMMARDRRTYRFVRETRLGRVSLAESTEVGVIADRVTDYVAERIVERDKALAMPDGLGARLAERSPSSGRASDEPIRIPSRVKSNEIANALSWLVIGLILGVGFVLLVTAYRTGSLV